MTKEEAKILEQVRTAVLGIPGTDDKGMAGDLKDIKTQLTVLNGCVRKNTSFRNYIVRIGLPLMVFIMSVIAKISFWK